MTAVAIRWRFQQSLLSTGHQRFIADLAKFE
jgi:hypothetical protein